MFAFIADAFSFIGFRRTQVADFRCYRANFFLVRTAHNNLVRSGYVKGDAGRRLFNNRMGETQCEVNVVSLFCCTVANALDFQRFAEAFGYAFHHVVDQGTGQAVHGPVFFFIIGTFYGEYAVVQGDLHCLADLAL